jgi:hypothetical protein
MKDTFYAVFAGAVLSLTLFAAWGLGAAHTLAA